MAVCLQLAFHVVISSAVLKGRGRSTGLSMCSVSTMKTLVCQTSTASLATLKSWGQTLPSRHACHCWDDCRSRGRWPFGSRDPRRLSLPHIEEEDIRQALAYAAWRVEEVELPFPVA